MKKRIVILLVIIISLSFSSFAFATNVNITNFEVEPNNTYYDSNIITVGNSINGQSNYINDQDHYIFAATVRTLNWLFLKSSNDSSNYVTMIYDRTTDTYVKQASVVDNNNPIERLTFIPNQGDVYEITIQGTSQSQMYYQLGISMN